MVFMWITSDRVGLTRGAMAVLSRSILQNGSRIGVIRCSLARPQESMIVRPRKCQVLDGLPVVREVSPCRRAQHQVELLAREQAIGHLGDNARPAPMSPRRVLGILGEQVDGHSQRCVVADEPRMLGRLRLGRSWDLEGWSSLPCATEHRR